MTDELLDRLSQDLRPARTGEVVKRLALALGLGSLLAGLGMGFTLGVRHDVGAMLHSPMFWMKTAYGLALGLIGAAAVERLARPGASAARRLVWLAAPLAAVIVLAIAQLAAAPSAVWRTLVMGDSAMICPWRIMATSIPVFVALVWALRGLGPTRLRLAGTAAGLIAGGFGAAAYALHCPEAGAPFVAIWYSMGILGSAVIGAVVGPRLLRW